MSKPLFERVVVTYPSGNTTALLVGDMPAVDRATLNHQIQNAWLKINPNNPPIEQCGILSKPRNVKSIGRLEMLGGEFCGNATRSAVWVFMKGQNGSGQIETSGCSEPLKYEVKNNIVKLEMPIPTVANTKKGILVTFDGMAQLVMFDTPPTEMLTEILATNWNNVRNKPAVGVTSYDATKGAARFSVWVKEVKTIFNETACGSGTAAIGAALAIMNGGNQSCSIRQPSGESIRVDANLGLDGIISALTIAGTVTVLYDGGLVV